MMCFSSSCYVALFVWGFVSSYCVVWFVVVLLWHLVCRCLIIAFGLSSSYCNVWFVFDLLRRGVCRHIVVSLYLCRGDSDRKSGFDSLKISDYGR